MRAATSTHPATLKKRRWRYKYPDKAKAASERANKKYAEKHGSFAEVSKRYRANNPTHTRRSQLRSRYGMTLEEFNDASNARQGRCDICGNIPRGKLKVLRVDHDHETGIRRGLLCHHCNIAIGHFKDSIPTLRNAIAYLEKHKC